MTRLRTILCPIDLGPCADKALALAAEFAEKFAGELVVLYVVPEATLILPDGLVPVPPDVPDESELLATSQAAVAKHLTAPEVEKAKPRIEVRIGSAETEIVEAAKALSADLIVIGTHGRTGLAHFFLGSVAEKIVRTAPCPVLTVRG